ncbi:MULTISPECIES: helix-turn-helix domain-containing protein [Streptomyces]|uniref:XRE family transcriptional regulator n=2 Tax=Streptomyces TaxID=1883 RepID=A0A3M8F133_9ACTN|nr:MULTISPECIES: helix-turn-helix transcriptional regulator [Streptomyces]KNE80175.1 XRE family transcriptional regulator [Streptomyces fradiae]OFA40075.1 transcriptional regulator [Streptomyces fradiae]PQM21632.1 XRE family transcriptional regulator [Streptomyces xinghaiensis]RKM94305.1 XRE family transcriptional regulator [Streptomyces xinghaiensis]RNC71905.1 XRE family transcriptional regulator [Streptomyces xinghaiensis]
MPAGGRPTVRSRRLGAALRRYREAAKLDQQHAARHIAGSITKISRLESGQVSARPGDVRLLLELYGVRDRDTYLRLEQLARNSNKRGWWLDYPWAAKQEYTDVITLESDATYIRTWQPLFIPGLLQTPAYVRALLDASLTVHSPDAVEEMVAIREARKRVIEEDGARFAAVIYEPALTAPMPSREAHREQLSHILSVAQRQNVSVQVLPMTEWRAAHMTSHFVMYSFGPEPAPEAVAFDSTTSTVILEDLEEMTQHAQIFEALRSAALTPKESMSFLRKSMEEISDRKEDEG